MDVNSMIVWVKFSIMYIFIIIAARANINLFFLYVRLHLQHILTAPLFAIVILT